MKVGNILETIGNTPHVKINHLFGDSHNIWMKLERANPGSSIKDRIALTMIEDAEQSGILKSGSIIIEPTSGNTGIALAMVCAVKKYKLILVMPESMSLERRRYMQNLGAELVLTPRELGMKGAIAKSVELLETTPNSWSPNQFENPANIKAHVKTTAQEILADFPNGLDYLITGVGTGGHISACAEVLKNRFPNLQVFAVEPSCSAVMSGEAPGPHAIQGIGAGFIPKNMKMDLIDGVIKVDPQDAFQMARRCVKEEGIFVGVSTGASLAAVQQKIAEIPAGKTILTFCYDTGERYLSVNELFI